MLPTKITAHRGYMEVAPENTLPAFEAALRAGAERIEFDVQESRDGQLVVHHDYSLGRTNNGTGPLFQYDWRELASLDAGSWFSPEYNGLHLCRLQEVLDRFGSAVEYEIELKWVTERFLHAAVTAVEQRGLLTQTEFTSPHPTTLQALRSLCPEARRGLFLSPYPEWMELDVGRKIAMGALTLGGFDVAHCPMSILDPSFLTMLQDTNIAVHAADCEDATTLEAAFVLGVEQLSTSRVAMAIQIRAETQK